MPREHIMEHEVEQLLADDTCQGELPSTRQMGRQEPRWRRMACTLSAIGSVCLLALCFWQPTADLVAGRRPKRTQSPLDEQEKPRAEQKFADKHATPLIPQTATEHNGIEWPPMTVHGTEEMHFFIIGDWGGLDGYINPPNGQKMVMYNGGELPGPHVFAHRPSGCADAQMSVCFNSHGGPGCPVGCGYNESVDREPQNHVAKQMQLRAKKTPPQFMLNVGDNFYWGGVPINCGSTSMAGIHWVTGHMFDTIFRQVYSPPELMNAVWFSVLGNHDYGGWMFTAAWDQQIAFTWHERRWRLPAQFWKQHVSFPDQDFSMDILLLDSNQEDAVDPNLRPTTNICSAAHNPPGANCASTGGPKSIADCPLYFSKLWQEQMQWAEKHLNASKATWQVIVTHFPCGHQPGWYKKLHSEFGLDLLVTGHTHVQLTVPLGGLLCVISGGGGGILSEAPPLGDDSNSYGFYDATVNKTHLVVESINFLGRSLGKWTANEVTAPPKPLEASHQQQSHRQPSHRQPSHRTPENSTRPQVAAHHAKQNASSGKVRDQKNKTADEGSAEKSPHLEPKAKCGTWCQLLR